MKIIGSGIGALVLALVVGCSGSDDGGTDDESTPGADVGQAVGETTADPDALVGETDTDTAHWDEGEPWEPPSTSTMRAYGGDVWSTVGDYPQAMNHCDSAQMRVSWRSLGEPLYAALTSYPSDGVLTFATPEAPSENAETNDGWIDAEAAEPATEGELILSACEQPVFRTTETNVLVDFVIEVTSHAPQV